MSHDDQSFRELRDIWLSRLMFNQFVGWAPETRTLDEFCATHGQLPAPNMEQLLEPDPELYLAGGPLAPDPCECDGICECGGG